MKYRLKLITNKDSDFKKLKADGYGGVIFSEKGLTAEKLSDARKNGLKNFVYIEDLTKCKCTCIDSDGITDGEVFAVSVAAVKQAIKSLNGVISEIDAFSVPVPCISGLLWNDLFPYEYEEFCGRDLYDDLPLLFDANTQYASIRVWYYRRAAEKIFSEFILPVCQYAKKEGKKVFFDLGNIERGDYAVRKLVLPSLFHKAKIPVIREENGERYFISPMHDRGAKTLFVTAMRHIMEMYAWDAVFSKEESEFSLLVWEEKYYRNSFEKSGIKAQIIDDFALSDMRLSALKRFDDILLAKGCMIENSKKEKVLNLGVRIDNAELLKRLDEVNN